MKLRYIHIRPPVDQDEWGNPLHCMNHGGFTIAYFATENDNNTITIEWNYAICHDKENFNKKLGREIAKGRFYSLRLNNFFSNFNSIGQFYDHLSDLNSHKLQTQYPIHPSDNNW